MNHYEKVGLLILLIVLGAIFAMAKADRDLKNDLVKLQITEAELTIEKLNYELSIYREQEAIANQVYN